jgi:hypothetical protein
MTIKQQLQTLKNNWLVGILLVGFVLFFLLMVQVGQTEFSLSSLDSGNYYPEQALAYKISSDGFAPEVADRKIEITASFNTEIENGEFDAAQAKLKSIIDESNSFILNENVRKQGHNKKSNFIGSYQLKVDSLKYDSVVSQLKEIGEVQYFSENKRDVTGSYTDIEIELQVEKERLKRYQEMYTHATLISDQIKLNDLLFDQERRIGYLEDALKNIDQKIEYVTLSVSITEKPSVYANVIFTTFSELVTSFVKSLNSLFALIFVVLPYALAAGFVWLAIRLFRKKN